MRHLLFSLIFCLALCAPSWGQDTQNYSGLGIRRDSGPDVSADYLDQARDYRNDGRYELARQSYALALSTCQTPEALEIIKRELNGVELILRSLR